MVFPTTSHDQNFKSLILGYPRQALAFFAPQEAAGIDDSAVITPIHRLGRYCCLDLAELCKTDRVAPVVIFLKRGDRILKSLHLGGDGLAFLSFHYIACVLREMPAADYKDSSNIVARLGLRRAWRNRARNWPM